MLEDIHSGHSFLGFLLIELFFYGVANTCQSHAMFGVLRLENQIYCPNSTHPIG